MKVRRFRAKKTVEPILEEGEVFIQYFDRDSIFYPEASEGVSGVGFDINLAKSRGGIDKYVEWIEPIEASDTAYYKRRKPQIEERIEALEIEKNALTEEQEMLRELISI